MITAATANPIRAPPPAAMRKSRLTEPIETVPARARTAVRNATSAVASLSSDSPSRIVTILRGRPIRRATAVAATASGGETTAPKASAAASGIGSSHQVSRPTVSMVNSTSATARSPIGRMFARISTRDVRIAAAYSSGGRKPSSTSSGVNSMVGTAGMNEAIVPTTTRTRGGGQAKPAAQAGDCEHGGSQRQNDDCNVHGDECEA